MSDNLPATPEGFIRAPQLASPNPPPTGYIAGAGPEEEDIATLKKRFDYSREWQEESRLAAAKDRDYYDGKQLSPEVLAVLRRRNQPEIWANRIRPAIDGVLGVLEAGKSDPRAHPRNPSDQDTADLASKTLRFIADSNRFDQVKLDCAENHQIEGIAAAIVEVDGEDITVTQIRYEEFFHDPHSRRPDFKDARWLGVAKWMDANDLKRAYPDKWDAVDPFSGSGTETTWEDKPDDGKPWVDNKMRRVMVVEEYRVDSGRWLRTLFCAGGVLESGPSPYQDDKGLSICPIEATSAYVDRNNRRYGRVRDMRPLQDEINARRSRLLHLANSRQVQQTDPNAPPIDSSIAKQEAAKADGVIPAGWQVVGMPDIATAQAALLQDSKVELERMGPTPAVLGRQDGSSQSGRARLVLQQAGMTELARVLGRFEDWEQRCYKQMWWRARQYWQAPKWIRITDDTNAPSFLQVNEPEMGTVMEPVMDEAGQPVMDPMTAQPAARPAIGVVGYKNRIAEIDCDIIVDSVPDTANLEQEVWQGLVELMKIMSVDDPRFEIAVEMSPLPDKSRVIEKLKGFRDQKMKEGAEQQAKAAEIAEAAAAAKIENDKASAAGKMAGAQLSIAKADQIQSESAAALAMAAFPTGLEQPF